jgi:hypothetical protein
MARHASRSPRRTQPPAQPTLTAGEDALERDSAPVGGPDVALGNTYTVHCQIVEASPFALLDEPSATVETITRNAQLVTLWPEPGECEYTFED